MQVGYVTMKAETKNFRSRRPININRLCSFLLISLNRFTQKLIVWNNFIATNFGQLLINIGHGAPRHQIFAKAYLGKNSSQLSGRAWSTKNWLVDPWLPCKISVIEEKKILPNVPGKLEKIVSEYFEIRA